MIDIPRISCNLGFGSDETVGNVVNELELFVFTVEFETNWAGVHDSTGNIRNREDAISLSWKTVIVILDKERRDLIPGST